MIKRITLFAGLVCLIVFNSNAQQTFVKSYGNPFVADVATDIIQTSDNEYVFTGISSIGLPDLSLIKIDSVGETVWDYSFGGDESDVGSNLIQTPTGDFIIVGTSMNTSFNNDAYIVKTDSNGDTLWTKIIDGTGAESLSDIDFTDDGQYMAAGQYTLNDTNINAYFVKINTDGDTSWTRNYGSGLAETSFSIVKDANGDFAIAGQSLDDDTGDKQALFMKIAPNGDSLTTKIYGAAQEDIFNFIDTTSDGGFLLLGKTASIGAGLSDIYLVKTNTDGDEVWSQTYGGSGNDEGMTLMQATDGSMLIVGSTASYGNGGKDLYLISADANGDTLWTKTFGGAQDEVPYSIIPTNDGGYMLCGSTRTKTGFDDQAFIMKMNSSFEMEMISTKITGDTSFCVGETVDLYSNIDVVKHNWSDANTTQDINVSTPGDYFVDIENFMGIKGYSDTVTVYEHDLPVIDLVSQLGDTVCGGAETVLETDISNYNSLAYTYEWIGSITSDTLIADTAGKYKVTVTDYYTCTAYDSITLAFTELPDTNQLCAVSYDTATAQMKITWEEVMADNIVSYNIYRQISAVYQIIGNVPYGDENVYYDGDAIPALRPKYKISVVDTCGNESVLSNYHWAMNMAVTNNNIDIGISWSTYYIDNDTTTLFSNFEIYRGESMSSFTKLDDISYKQSIYTDPDPEALTKRMYYVIAGVLNSSCDIGSDSVTRIFTNVANNGVITDEIENVTFENSINVYPNPFKNYIDLDVYSAERSDVTIELLSITGQKVIEQPYTSQSAGQNHYTLYLNDTDITSGMYIVSVNVNGQYFRKQVIKY